MSQAPLCSCTPLPQDSPWYFQQAEAPHRLLIVVLGIQFHGTLWFPLKGSLLRRDVVGRGSDSLVDSVPRN